MEGVSYIYSDPKSNFCGQCSALMQDRNDERSCWIQLMPCSHYMTFKLIRLPITDTIQLQKLWKCGLHATWQWKWCDNMRETGFLKYLCLFTNLKPQLKIYKMSNNSSALLPYNPRWHLFCWDTNWRIISTLIIILYLCDFFYKNIINILFMFLFCSLKYICCSENWLNPEGLT